MTRSIFDPTGPDTERSGSTFRGADADNRSRMPEALVDGVVEPPRDAQADLVGFDADGRPIDPARPREARGAADDSTATPSGG